MLARRRERDEQSATKALELTLPTHIAVFLDRSRVLSLIGDLTVLCVELASVVLYFLAAGTVDCATSSRRIHIDAFPLRRGFVVCNGVLSVFFFLHFASMLYLTPHRRMLLTSRFTVVTLLTVVPMALSFVLAVDGEHDASYPQQMMRNASTTATISTADIVTTVWSPSFLRIWWAHRHACTMLSKYQHTLHPAIKEIALLGVLVCALIVTGTGGIQFFDALNEPCVKEITYSFYLVMVTITTLGYGDAVPRSSTGQLLMILIIFVAMFFLPVALGKIGELSAFLSSQNSYTNANRHVIVCGQFSFVDLKVMVREFLFDNGTSKTALHIVLVTEKPLQEQVVRWLRQPSLRDRITVCVSDVLRKGQILRFRARAAEAVLLLSPRNAIAQRGDYETMMKSVVFHRYEPGVPQYLLLKRGMHVAAMRRTASTILERERLKYHLMGIALRLPLFIPFMVNLLKSSEEFDQQLPSAEQRHTPSAEHRLTSSTPSWWHLYLRGAACNIHIVQIPPTLHARLFSAAVLIVYTRMSITVIGIVRRSSQDTRAMDEVLLAPMKEKLLPSDRFVVIAPSSLDAANFVDRYMESHGSKAGVGEDRALNPIKSTTRNALHEPDGGATSNESLHAGAVRTPNPPAVIPATTRKSSAYPFQEHILLVDLSSAATENTLNSEENIECGHFQAMDVVRLLRLVVQKGINHNEHVPVVFLSGQPLSHQFSSAWPEVCRPIYHLRGYGTEWGHLRGAGVTNARAVVLFFSVEGERNDATVHVVAHMIHELLVEAGRDQAVPVVVEVEDLSLACLLPPRMSPFADEALMAKGRENYSCSPSFFSGRVISSTMIDTIVFQCLHNPCLPQIVLSLMGIPEDDGEMLIRLKTMGSEAHSAHVKRKLRHRRRGGGGDGVGAAAASSSRHTTQNQRGVFEKDAVFCDSIERFLPPAFPSKDVPSLCYGDLVACALKEHCIPLGLCRMIDSNELGDHMVGVQFLATSPPTQTHLRLTDAVYYLQV